MKKVVLLRFGCRGLPDKDVYGKAAVVSSDKGIKVFFFVALGGNFSLRYLTSLRKFLIFFDGLV